MSTITREFTKEQVTAHVIAKLDRYSKSTFPVSMASLAQMEKQILEIVLRALTAEPSPELVAARAKIEWLSGKLNAATDCKCDGATFYDASGRERCTSCGRDI